MSASEATPRLPASIDRYQVRELLGAGSFGAVYRAFDPRLKREVALKVLRPERMTSPTLIERFLREAEVAARLHHPHIVPIHDAGRAGDVYYIVSELIRGETLTSAIPMGGMEPRRAAELTAQLASALGYAHQQGVLHRDVKPQNIMVDERGSLHLMDFGLAGWMREEGTRLTEDGALMGTPLYMSPEQASGDTANVGPRSDLYSAGVVLYQLLTGCAPFDTTGTAALMYQIVHTAPAPPSRRRPGLDAVLEAICLKAMAKRPAERFGTGEEMAAALGAWGASAAAAPSPHAPSLREAETLEDRPNPPGSATRSAASAPVGRGRRGRSVLRWALGGGAILVLLVGLAVAVMATLLHPPSVPSRGDPPIASREPARAEAPFDGAEAKRLQQAWADYLGVPVERQAALGGGVTMKLVLIPPGSFRIGSMDSDAEAEEGEKPRHWVTITKPYYLGAHPVTRGQFAVFAEAEHYQTLAETDGGGYNAATRVLEAGPQYGWRDPGFAQTDDEPVVDLTWYDAMKFCEWLSEKEKKTYGLPTEAQWEHACRAGTTTRFWCGEKDEDLQGKANIADASLKARLAADYLMRPGLGFFQPWNDGYPFTSPVGRFPANPWGLYDMQGNVLQWCADFYDKDYYGKNPVINPQNISYTDLRVLRGGSWGAGPMTCRAANRFRFAPADRRGDIGCRVVLRLD